MYNVTMIGEEGESPQTKKPVVPGKLTVLTPAERDAAYKKQVDTGLIRYDVFKTDTEHLDSSTTMEEVVKLLKAQKAKAEESAAKKGKK